MRRTFFSGLCVAVLAMHPVSAMAEQGDQGAYALWVALGNGEKTYAVVDKDTDKSVVAKINDGKSMVMTGSKAKAALEVIEAAQPETPTVYGKGAAKVFTKTLSSEDEVIFLDLGDDEAQLFSKDELGEIGTAETLVIMDFQESSREGIAEEAEDLNDADLKTILKQQDTGWEGEKNVIVSRGNNITIDGKSVNTEDLLSKYGIDLANLNENDDFSQTVIIKKITKSVEHNADHSKVKIRVRGAKSPTPPMPPATNSLDEESDVVRQFSEKKIYSYSEKNNKAGTDKTYIHIEGADVEEATNFIDKIDGLSNREKAKMKKALSL